MAKPDDKTVNLKITSDEHRLVKRYCLRRDCKISDILRPVIEDIVTTERNLTKIEK